mmetsp:Transcript_52388/g.170015  ORF Transcript_52388/g.170015 Transcript_52388/m.170015 type:complete len:245 (+) Transcript_52388:36-770(+)
MLAPPPETLAVAASYKFDGDFEIGSRSLRLVDIDGSRALEETGVSVWDAALIFAKALGRQPALLFSGSRGPHPRVLELGSGTGVLGIAAALLGAEVVLTDLPALAGLAEQNVALNAESIDAAGGSARFGALDWQAPDLERFDGQVDVLLAADPVWRAEQAPLFAAVVRRVLTANRCRLLLARSDRTCVHEAAEALFEALAAEGLEAEALDQAMLDSPELPVSARHFVRHSVVKVWVICPIAADD